MKPLYHTYRHFSIIFILYYNFSLRTTLSTFKPLADYHLTRQTPHIQVTHIHFYKILHFDNMYLLLLLLLPHLSIIPKKKKITINFINIAFNFKIMFFLFQVEVTDTHT